MTALLDIALFALAVAARAGVMLAVVAVGVPAWKTVVRVVLRMVGLS